MNDLVRRPSIPNEITVFMEQPSLLPGENRRHYELLRQMMIDDIQPRTTIEWLWTFDLIELSWELLRYRRLKQKVLETNRPAAIESILWDLDGACLPAGTSMRSGRTAHAANRRRAARRYGSSFRHAAPRVRRRNWPRASGNVWPPPSRWPRFVATFGCRSVDLAGCLPEPASPSSGFQSGSLPSSLWASR